MSRELGNIIKNQSEIENTITEMKNTLQRIDSRFNTEEQISDLETE